MAERVAGNASPLIFLAPVGLLHLLRLAGSDVVVPEPVWSEIASPGEADATARALAEAAWIRRVEAVEVPQRVVEWDLGRGESAVLAWALAHPGTGAVIDDLAGRRCARTLGVELTGTLGLVLRAKQRGLASSARDTLLQLRANGMYLSNDVLGRALARVGETL